MKKVLLSFLVLLFTGQSYAGNCLTIKMLEDKISKQVDRKNEIEDAILLNNKLKDVAGWEEYSNIKKQISEGEEDITSSIYSAKEIDILLLMDALSDQKQGIYSEMGKNAGVITFSITTTLITTKLINKLMAGNLKYGFMVKVNKYMADPENAKKVNKILTLSTVLSMVTPLYMGYKEYKLYQLLQETKKKIETLEELNSEIPELSILEERIENDTLKLRELEAMGGC